VDRIGRYEVEARVGKGAMGEVFKARDPVLNRPVAIKIISANLVSDEQFRRRFLQEARSAAQLNHRNIVTVFEFNEDPAQVFMVMEFLEGSDLRDAIGRRSLSRVEDKLSIVEQVCEGLAYAHSKGIVHRDLKPANIRLLPNLTPKIMDFGLARLSTSEITRAGTVMGTPDYMSPEQVRAEKVDARSDIFSLGAVLYHLLSGRKPFEQESVHSILYDVLERDPPPIRDVAPDLPPLVVPIVEKALRKDANKRYPDAAAFRAALRDARRAIAAGRAAAAALSPGAVGEEATITRFDVPTPSYPSLAPTSPSLKSRPGSAPPASAASLASPPTIALRSGTKIEGATALDLPAVAGGEDREGSTERPAETLIGTLHEPVSPRTSWLVGIAVGAVLLAAGGLFTWQQRASRAKEAQDLARLEKLRHETQLDLARSELLGKNYEGAIQEAEAVLAEAPENAAAKEIVAQARKWTAALTTAADTARDAVARGDAPAAERALSEVLAIDPGHPVVADLSQALNQHFRSRTEAARSAADQARKGAVAVDAEGQSAFVMAERLASGAAAKLEEGQFVEATRRFTEAADAYGRARREAEAAKAAQARAAEVSRLQAMVRPSVAPPPTAPPATSAPPTSAAPRTLPPSTAAPSGSPPGQANPPPPAPGVPASAATVPSVPVSPPAVAAVGAEAAVRRTLADYARALEKQDLTLFRSVMPGLTADQEKSLRDSFKAVKSHEVSLAVESIQLAEGKATVRLSRQDTVNGQSQKPRQQTFRLAQRGSAWAIESIGQ
jgi:serine/threonine protein kinase